MSIDKFGNDSQRISRHQSVGAGKESAKDIKAKNKQQELTDKINREMKSGQDLSYSASYGDTAVNNIPVLEQPKGTISWGAEPTVPEMSEAGELDPVQKNKDTLTGNIGLVIFNPKMYSGVVNTKEEVAAIKELLQQVPDVSPELKDALIKCIEDGNVAFGHNIGPDGKFQNPEEILTLTEQDIELLLEYADKTKDVTDREAVLEQERLFRKEYFANYSETISPDEIEDKNEILHVRRAEKQDSRAQTFGRGLFGDSKEDIPELLDDPKTTVPSLSGLKEVGKALLSCEFKKASNLFLHWGNCSKIEQVGLDMFDKRYGFTTVSDKGVNPYLSDGTIASDVDRALAEYAAETASDKATVGACFTGTKHALLASGVIGNYGAIVDEDGNNISTPRVVADWFAERPEMFQEVKYIEDENGQARELNSADLYELPPGYIVIWVPEEGERFAGEAGHIGITNGNGQINSDHTDALHWEDYPKGEHGTFRVFKLKDENWDFNKETQKLEYTGPETPNVIKDRELAEKLNDKDKNG